MLDELNFRLMQTKKRLRAKQKLEAKLAQVQANLRELWHRNTELKKRLTLEQADVEKLESLSLTGLFYAVIGTKREHLNQEKQEYVAAKLKYDESMEAIEFTHADATRIQHELEAFQSADRDYAQLIKEKERWLADRNDSRAARMLELTERLTDLKADQKELAEAIKAGEHALDGLRQVQSDLHSAANWGTWDLLGGGLISTMVKHSKIDAARCRVHAVQSQLRRFQAELTDIGKQLNLSLEIGDFLGFADYFFDGLIVDWVVQSRIREASSACSSAKSRVSSSVSECRRRLAKIEQERDAVERQRRSLIEDA